MRRGGLGIWRGRLGSTAAFEAGDGVQECDGFADVFAVADAERARFDRECEVGHALGFGDGLLERFGEGIGVVREMHRRDEAGALGTRGTNLGEFIRDVGAFEPKAKGTDGGAVSGGDCREREGWVADIVQDIGGVWRDEGPGLGLELRDHRGIVFDGRHGRSLPCERVKER